MQLSELLHKFQVFCKRQMKITRDLSTIVDIIILDQEFLTTIFFW